MKRHVPYILFITPTNKVALSLVPMLAKDFLKSNSPPYFSFLPPGVNYWKPYFYVTIIYLKMMAGLTAGLISPHNYGRRNQRNQCAGWYLWQLTFKNIQLLSLNQPWECPRHGISRGWEQWLPSIRWRSVKMDRPCILYTSKETSSYREQVFSRTVISWYKRFLEFLTQISVTCALEQSS
jgi:hypothetical protein